MYIQPNSTIKLYNGIPLDPNYENTIYFDNAGQQLDYFHSTARVIYTFQNQSYQRVNKGVMRIAINAEYIYNCNYLAFQNTAFGIKWFYAFITKVEYINDNVSEITFEIDLMQTYFFDITLRECFVEREHSASDNVGDNTIEENVELGDYVSNLDGDLNLFDLSLVPIMVTTDCYPTGSSIHDELFICKNDTIYNGLQFFAIDPNNTDEGLRPNTDSWLAYYVKTIRNSGKAEAIVDIYFYPLQLLNGVNFSTGSIMTHYYHLRNTNIINHTLDFSYMYNVGINNYFPKNNKLYTYPYNLMLVTNNNGASCEFKYEKFVDLNGNRVNYGNFRLYGCISNTTDMRCVPTNYQETILNNNYGIVGGGFPHCAWTSDVYYEWLRANGQQFKTQNKYKVLNSVASGTALTGISLSKGNTLSATASAINTGLNVANAIEGAMAKQYDLQAQPDVAQGNQSNTISCITGTFAYSYYRKSVDYQHARMIDSYFSRFGYATKVTKVPNRGVRARWCYTKTIGCIAIGNAPADDVATIEKIYDKGITFWRNPSEVGRFDLDNPPL